MTVGTAEKYMLARGCPNCSRQPPFRLFAWEVRRYEEEDPDLPVSTHYCRSCRCVWVAYAWMYQQASLDESS